MPASSCRGIPSRIPGAAAAASLAGAATLALVPAAAAAPATVPVTMRDFTFSAPLLTVSVGDTVTWTNQDKALHDATTTKAPVSFGSPLLKTGESWSYTVTTPGLYQYNCSIHPKMVAAIQAVGSAAPASPATGTDKPRATEQPTATKPATSGEHAHHAAPADATSTVAVAVPSAAPTATPTTTPRPAPTKAGSRPAKAAPAAAVGAPAPAAVAAPAATTPDMAPAATAAAPDRIDLTPELVGGGITIAALVAGLLAYGLVAGRRSM